MNLRFPARETSALPIRPLHPDRERDRDRDREGERQTEREKERDSALTNYLKFPDRLSPLLEKLVRFATC